MKEKRYNGFEEGYDENDLDGVDFSNAIDEFERKVLDTERNAIVSTENVDEEMSFEELMEYVNEGQDF